MVSVQNAAQQGLAAYGLGKTSVSFAAYLRVFLEAAPMVQALILMGLYALLPFFILIKRLNQILIHPPGKEPQYSPKFDREQD